MHLPDNAIYDIAPVDSPNHILLIMLPGAKITPQQMVENGLISTLRVYNLAVDVLVLDAHADLYFERNEIEGLLHQTMDDVRAHGYKRIWLLGISLGGTGAMICSSQHPKEIEGVLLLAPFLGTRGLVAEVDAAGGLQKWQAGNIDSRDQERELLEKIRIDVFDTHLIPPLFLGYGSEDRYRGSSMMLAAFLPSHRVTTISGGHDWETWKVLWQNLLEMKPFNLVKLSSA